MSDPDTRFVGTVFIKFREDHHISFACAPAKRRTGIGSLERKHAVIARVTHEVMHQRDKFDKIANIGSMECFAAMVTVIVNGQIGNADGFSASQRLCARNPRLPCSMVDSANYCE